VFNDNFLGTTLNASFWNTYMTSASTQGGPWDSAGLGGSGVGGINDVDYFEPSQDSVNNGLTITAAQKSVVGNNYTNGQLVSQTFPITSGVVDSYGKFEFDGGYLQISMKAPTGDGAWPGLWLLPGQGAGNVGNNFEVDIQGGGYTDGSANPNDVFEYSLHTPSGTVGGVVDTGIDLTASYNTYAINWIPGQSITWYLNGKAIAEITSAQAPIPDEPMELIMDNQVASTAASSWRTVLDGSTPQTMPMQVGDVQLYQAAGSGDSVTAPPGATPPATITAMTETLSSGALDIGKTAMLTMTTSEAVAVTGAPTLSLNDGGTATYDAAKSSATSLVFDYKVGTGDSSVASLAATSINLAGGSTIEDAAGNNANLSLSGLSQAGPITNVSGTATIDAGSTLNLQGTTLTVGALANNGTVDSTGVSALDGGALTNSSLLEATSGVLTVGSSSLTNSGNLLAAGGTLDVTGAVTGGGTATISGKNSVLEFGAASAETTTFSSGATAGILKLDNASSFTGTVVGLAMGDGIDLANFLFSNNPIITGVTGSGAVGTTTDVTVKDGSLSVTLALLNQHASQFGLNPAAYSLVSDNNTSNHGTLFLATPH
jgi:beta-glucanase (GH16 family)